MGAFSVWHWMVLALAIAWAVAVGKILRRMGFSPGWAILALFPLLNLVLIWIVALMPWPVEDRPGVAQTFE